MEIEHQLTDFVDPSSKMAKKRKLLTTIVKLGATAVGVTAIAYAFGKHPELRTKFRHVFQNSKGTLPKTLVSDTIATVEIRVPELTTWFSEGKRYAWIWLRPWTLAFHAGHVVVQVILGKTKVRIPFDTLDLTTVSKKTLDTLSRHLDALRHLHS